MACDINLAAFGREQTWGKALERKRKIYSDNSLQIEELQPLVETQRVFSQDKREAISYRELPNCSSWYLSVSCK